MNKKLLDMDNKEARKFFLKNESYFTLKLPSYFNFEKLLKKIYTDNSNKKTFDGYCKSNPKQLQNINYDILINKKGKMSWRKLMLINPIAYVGIVQEMCTKENWNLIVDRFKEFQANDKIVCCSIPVESQVLSTDKKEQILDWWNSFEQITIKEYINYNYMIISDISNCYPSIYTHTISWALHDEQVAKTNFMTKKPKLYGDILDASIQKISYAQTNGIPQGSKLFDFIAEMVLGYADMLLGKRLEEEGIVDYKIIRFRDDYRIFSNSKNDLEKIFKELTKILNHLNLQINDSKTICTNDIVSNSIKSDKIYGIMNPINESLNLQKKLFAIRECGHLYPNSGLLLKLILAYYKNDIYTLSEKPDYFDQIISIIVDIMENNNRVYAECISILSKLLSFLDTGERNLIIDSISRKLRNETTTEYLDIWLQRLTITYDLSKEYLSSLCKKVYESNNIWDCSWSKYSIDENMIIDNTIISSISNVVTPVEIDDFLDDIY